MADNLTLNSGSGGSTLSTDEVTRATIVQHVQYVKLMNGTDAAVDVIPGEATNGLDVDVTRVQGTVTVDGSGVTQPVSHGALTELAAAINASSQVDVNIAASGATLTVASHAVTNAGTFAVQVDGSALTALQLIDNASIADDAAFTPATTGVTMAGYFADDASTDSVDEGDGGAARMTLDRKVIVNPQPHTTGGLTIFRSIDLDETEEEVKATAGQVYGWFIANLATTTRFVKFYNATAANTTVGTTTPVMTLPIPGNSTDDVAANALGGMGLVFDTAITVAATSALADADTTAPGANDVVINLYYK